jgi:DNA-binding SARP family transcriptional activator
MLSLSNCRCDAAEFMAKTRDGLDHLENNELWQADNAFYAAHRLWQGEFMPGIELDDQADIFRSEIQNRYLETAASWCTILMDNHQLSRAADVAGEALKVDSINHELVKTLYRIHSRQNDPARAAKAIRNYRDALNGAAFGTEEIESIVESLFEP